jgi:hypothetical protein
VQNARDSFYEALRNRLSTLNPERTVVIRGVTRPGVLVDENETQSTELLADCFHLRWKDSQVTSAGALPLVCQACEITYATAGTALNGGLDRGRALTSMDAELTSVLQAGEQHAAKYDYSALREGGTAQALQTGIWWSDVSFQPLQFNKERVQRSALVEVVSYLEAGEL